MSGFAVQIKNTWSDYDDIAFDLSLKVELYHSIIPHLTVQSVDGSSPFLSTIWRLQALLERRVAVQITLGKSPTPNDVSKIKTR